MGYNKYKSKVIYTYILEHTVKNRCGINNITKYIKLQASSKELFILAKVVVAPGEWLHVWGCCYLAGQQYKLCCGVQCGQCSESFQRQIYVQSVNVREYGPVQLRNSRRLWGHVGVTEWRTRQSVELQVSHKNILVQPPLKLITGTPSANAPDFQLESWEFPVNLQ